MEGWLTPRQLQQKVVDLVNGARHRHNITEGCGGQEVCERLGLRLERRPITSGADGLLVDDHVIVNDALSWVARIEFTIFHEIVHHLLDEDGELIDYFTRTLRNDPVAFEAAIERCCHQGAAEFLMPNDHVRQLIAAEGFSTSVIERVAAVGGASIVAAAIQAAYYAPIDCYVVLCAHGRVPNSWPTRDGLYIEYACAPWHRKYPLARFTPIPLDHILHHTWRDRAPVSSQSYVPFRSGKRPPCRCEARWVRGRVVGILAFEDTIPTGQLPMPFAAEGQTF